MRRMDISKIISLDESGFNNVSLTGMGLAPIGKRINMPISGKKTINHSLICALTTEGIIHYEIRTGSVNGDIFKKFIEDTINKLPSPGYCFIFDNVSFHHNKEMIKMIEMRGHTCFHTPPYSPNNNPIETIFGMLKYRYRRDCK